MANRPDVSSNGEDGVERAPRGPRPRSLDRRRFLSMGAAGGAGALFGAFLRDRLEPGLEGTAEADAVEPEVDLRDAAGPPDGVRAGLRRIVWSVETTEPVVALSFDDGPDPYLTPRILDILDAFDLQVTFCAMGRNIAEHPELLREIVARGHEVGNHTWNHLDLVEQRPTAVRHELELTHQACGWAADVTPRLFRPPRGRLSGIAARHAANLGYDIALWSVGRGVAGEGSEGAVTEHIVGTLEPGDIILLHDGVGRETFRTDLNGPGPVRKRREVEVRALPRILEGALERGFRLTSVSELLEMNARGAP